MKFLGTILIILASCAVSGIASAQGIPGDPQGNKFYAELHGGVTIASDSDLSDPAFSGAGITSAKSEFDTGFNVGGLLGYKFKNGLRVEGEYTYRQVGYNDISVCVSAGCASASGAGVNVGGDVGAHAIMANAFWEPRFGKLLPSIGGGVGVGIINSTLRVSYSGYSATSDESDTVFAYQAGAGLGYEFFPNIIASVDYRYWATSDPKFGSTTAEVSTHNITGGVRFQF